MPLNAVATRQDGGSILQLFDTSLAPYGESVRVEEEVAVHYALSWSGSELLLVYSAVVEIRAQRYVLELP